MNRHEENLERENLGVETRRRLTDWQHGRTASERFAAQLLNADKFKEVDPIHPLGGRDGRKDALCRKDGLLWAMAAFFSRDAQSKKQIEKKFLYDLKGVKRNKADAFVFVTNQEILDADRKALIKLALPYQVEIYHRERIAVLLDSAQLANVRLEYLGISMTTSEQLAFLAERDRLLKKIESKMDGVSQFIEDLRSGDKDAAARLKEGIPLRELREFKETLSSLTSPYSFVSYGNGLYVPLADLKEYKEILDSLTSHMSWEGPNVRGLRVPLEDLKEFKKLLEEITGGFISMGPINRLNVPLQDLREYEKSLDRIIKKKEKLERLVKDS